MKISLTASPVVVVEQRLERSKQQLRQQWDQARSTLNSTLVQPSSLLVVTGMGALLGIWLTRGKATAVRFGIASAWPLVRSTLFALLIRFIVQHVTRDRARE